ncbi:MAG: prepilin peptidase [Pseudomonadota bacterium]
MFETAALIAATAALIPLMVVIAWHDLKYLKIPNWTVVAIFGAFLVTGIWGLPLETYLWRIGYAVLVLAAGFLLFMFGRGKIGGGDMKLIAALVPFLTPSDIPSILFLFGILSLFGILVHRFIYARRRGEDIGWEALDQKIYFPVGLLIGVVMCVYLVRQIGERFLVI